MVAKVIKVTPVDSDNQVITTQSSLGHMNTPCDECPWKISSKGIFPAGAFRASAMTSYDWARTTFGCHTAGKENPKTCAGFLLQGSDHNLGIRIRILKGDIDPNEIHNGGHQLYPSFKAMAIANGVPADDECLEDSRED